LTWIKIGVKKKRKRSEEDEVLRIGGCSEGMAKLSEWRTFVRNAQGAQGRRPLADMQVVMEEPEAPEAVATGQPAREVGSTVPQVPLWVVAEKKVQVLVRADDEPPLALALRYLQDQTLLYILSDSLSDEVQAARVRDWAARAAPQSVRVVVAWAPSHAWLEAQPAVCAALAAIGTDDTTVVLTVPDDRVPFVRSGFQVAQLRSVVPDLFPDETMPAAVTGADAGVPLTVNGLTALLVGAHTRVGIDGGGSAATVAAVLPPGSAPSSPEVRAAAAASAAAAAAPSLVDLRALPVSGPRVTFLGTAAAEPTKTRNVSSVIVSDLPLGRAILLDAGEATHAQGIRAFGHDRWSTILRNLIGVYISHEHADHHMGLSEVLLARRRAVADAAAGEAGSVPHLRIVANDRIRDALQQLHDEIGPILPEDGTFSMIDSWPGSPTVSRIAFADGDSRVWLRTVAVRHCYGATAAIIGTGRDDDEERWVAYSGDTIAPCAELVEAARNVRLLIHEATLSDGQEGEAARKRHSTVSQALEVARATGADCTALTHFSARYSTSTPLIATTAAAAPDAPTTSSDPPALPPPPYFNAHDLMSFPLSWIPVLPTLGKCLDEAAADQSVKR
jgi:ribonuclease BN (tRNA processing enzyme)